MKDCARYAELISLLLDGELPEPQKTELDAHLAVCPDCRRVRDAFAYLSSAMGEDAEPPEALRADVMNAVRAEAVSDAPAKKHRFGWGRLAALAACFALIVFAASGSGLFRRDSASAPRAMIAAKGASAGESAESDVRASAEGFSVTQMEDAQPVPAPTDALQSGDSALLTISEPDDSGVQSYGELQDEVRLELNSNGDIRVTSGSDSTVALTDVADVRLFSGEVTAIDNRADWEPIAILTDEESILLIMEMLEFSEAADSRTQPSGEPLLIVDVNCVREQESYTLSVWLVEGRLYCLSSLDDSLYVTAGDIGELFEFIAGA